MKSATIAVALRKATRWLKNVDITNEHPKNLAYTLIALTHVPSTSDIKVVITDRLKEQLDQTWIEEGELGEVFTVFNALHANDAAAITGTHLAYAARRLMASEVKLGGPYQNGEGETLLSANAQIALFLTWAAAPLPNVDAFLSNRVHTRQLTDSQLLPYPLMALLSRAGDLPLLNEYVRRDQTDGVQLAVIDTALALLVLTKQAQYTIRPDMVSFLTLAQQPDGSWPGEPFFADDGTPVSGLLTTAVICQVLVGLLEPRPRDSDIIMRQKQSEAINVKAERQLVHVPVLLRTAMLSALRKLYDVDSTQEIRLLTQAFHDSLYEGTALPSSIVDLGAANVFCWIAYTIYDDFLDNEGKPELLPVANVALRLSIDMYRHAFENGAVPPAYVDKVFAHMDRANLWEVSACRFDTRAKTITLPSSPDHADLQYLAECSFAHALGPMALLGLRRYPVGSMEWQSIEAAFRHYLIARHLNDDIHDWLDDFKAGRLTYVVSMILADLHIKPGCYNQAGMIERMKRTFWQKTALRLADTTLQHVAASRRAFLASGLIKSNAAIFLYLETIETAMQTSLAKQQEGLTFLQSYKAVKKA